MNAGSNNKFILKCWHHSVSINGSDIEVCFEKEGFSHRLYRGLDNECSGWYARYYEGVFIILRDGFDRIFIGSNGVVVDVGLIEKINWSSGFGGRSFECFNKENELLFKFNYHSLRRFILNPFGFFGEIFMPDDDWGLIADLPSFVHSSIEGGSIHRKFNNI